MIPIACKITNFSLHLFVYFFEKIIILVVRISLCRKEYLACTSTINYRNTDKPACLVLSFVAFVTQVKNSMKGIFAIHPAITENMENTLVKRAPKINYWKAISQYASYSAMFCPLHSNIGKESSMKSISAIHPAITKNMENILVNACPIFWSVKAIASQFLQWQTRFIT